MFVTHDQEEALAVADRVGVMRAGRLEQIDSPETLYNRPTSEFVAEFVGLTNRLPGVAAGDSATVLASTVPLLPGSVNAGPVTVLVRPEALRLTQVASSPPVGPSELRSHMAIVAGTSFLGSYGRVQARLADGTLLVAQAPAAEVAALTVGDVVAAAITPTPALATARTTR